MNTNEKLKIIDLLEEKGFERGKWCDHNIMALQVDGGYIEFETTRSYLMLGSGNVGDEGFTIDIDSVWHLTTIFLALGI